jgi:hypothetical protein
MDLSSNVVWGNLETRLINLLNAFQGYRNQVLQDPVSPINTETPIPPRREQPRTNQRQTRHTDHHEYEMLNDMIYYYSQNIREYNANIRELIYRVEDYQTARRARHSSRNRYTNAYYNYTQRDNPFRMYYHTQWIPTTPLGAQTPVLLTREEISRATLTYGFTEEMIIRDASGEITNVCPISLEPLQIGDVICEIRGCNHKFKRPNLMTWLNRNSNCPVCRYNLRTPLNENEPLTHEEHEEMEQDENQEEDEIREDPSGNQINPEVRRIQDSLSQIFQNVFQGVNVDSFSDGSANLLYEFEFPIYNNAYNTNSIINDFMRNDIPRNDYGDDEIQDEQDVD